MDNIEIPAFIRDERRRKARQNVERTFQKLLNILRAILLTSAMIAIFISGYAGYKYLSEESKIVYVREIVDMEQPHSFVSATVTAYTSSVDETDDDPFVTASGKLVRKGTLACPSMYEFGTIVEIEGERYTCEDRMNKRYRHTSRFDIWFETKHDAYLWGKKDLSVKVYLNN